LRSIARNADTSLRVDEVQPLSNVPANGLRTVGYVVRILGVVGSVGLVLALSGLYAVMSFTVSRRTREIGIRMALGSTSSRVVFAILRTPLIQAGLGSVLGVILFTLLPIPLPLTLGYAIGMAGYMVLMFAVCMLACLVPARRVLRVDPIAALRTD